MKSVFFKIFCLFFLTILSFDLLSQVRINVRIDDINDSILYLVKYKSDKVQVVIDSSSISSTNKKVFKNSINYDDGIYVLTDSKQNALFEILLGKDQKFSLKIDDLMDLDTYKIRGCKESADYLKIYSKSVYNNLYIKALESEMEYNPDNKNRIESLNKELYEYLESMLSEDENSFLNTYIKFIKKVQIPDNYKDSVEQYIVDHYFEDLPLCDVRILNTRLLKNKLDDYFVNYMTGLDSDVICDKIDDLILKTSDCLEVRDYILWYLYSRFFGQENVNDEPVFIHLVDKYFSELDIVNLTQGVRKEIVKRADILRKITIGQQSPTLSYVDENGNMISLDGIESENIVLFFYKPECHKCMKDKVILDSLKQKYEHLMVLPINISEENYDNVSQDIIVQYDIMTTPTIYLLNKDKDIIAKHIKVEEIEFHIIKE